MRLVSMRILRLATLLFAVTLSACGQKGPLYLPQDPGATAPASGAETPNADDRDADDPDKKRSE